MGLRSALETVAWRTRGSSHVSVGPLGRPRAQGPEQHLTNCFSVAISAPELHLKARPPTEQAERFANRQLPQIAHTTRLEELAAGSAPSCQVSQVSGSMTYILITSLLIVSMAATAIRMTAAQEAFAGHTGEVLSRIRSITNEPWRQVYHVRMMAQLIPTTGRPHMCSRFCAPQAPGRVAGISRRSGGARKRSAQLGRRRIGPDIGKDGQSMAARVMGVVHLPAARSRRPATGDIAPVARRRGPDPSFQQPTGSRACIHIMLPCPDVS